MDLAGKTTAISFYGSSAESVGWWKGCWGSAPDPGIFEGMAPVSEGLENTRLTLQKE